MTTPSPDVGKIGQAVAENGRVLATLDDWRAIMFIMAILLIGEAILIAVMFRNARLERKDAAAERAGMAAENASEREKMWAVADKFGEAAEKIGEQTNKLVTELTVLRAVAARVESQAERP